MILALARKELEIAHYMDGLTEKQRLSKQATAEAYYELAKGFYPVDKQPGVEAAWAISLNHARTDGYTSEAVFEIMAPHRLFADG